MAQGEFKPFGQRGKADYRNDETVIMLRCFYEKHSKIQEENCIYWRKHEPLRSIGIRWRVHCKSKKACSCDELNDDVERCRIAVSE